MRAWIKSFIQRQLARRGMRLTYSRDDLWPPDFDLLSIVVESYFRTDLPRTLVQIGANDGVTNDPVDSIIRHYELLAVRVEPLPEPFRKLQARHAGDPSVLPVQAAVGPIDGQSHIWRIEAPGDAQIKLSTIASFDRSVIEKHYRRYSGLGGRLAQQQVDVISPASLVEKHLPHGAGVDILQIDTEGHDAAIVRLFLEAGIQPRMINYEHNNLRGEDDRDCLSRLRSEGYLLARYGRDTIAIRGQNATERSAGA
jgi:FkbM family methyltransferase